MADGRCCVCYSCSFVVTFDHQMWLSVEGSLFMFLLHLFYYYFMWFLAFVFTFLALFLVVLV